MLFLGIACVPEGQCYIQPETLIVSLRLSKSTGDHLDFHEQ